jgi:hypothetical protein
LGKPGFRLKETASSTIPVAFWLARIYRQLDGWASFPRNHRPVASFTPPPRPRFGAEVAAHQEQHDGEHDDADEPKDWISDVEHSQNVDRCCAKSCTFEPDGKSGSRPAEGAGDGCERSAPKVTVTRTRGERVLVAPKVLLPVFTLSLKFFSTG